MKKIIFITCLAFGLPMVAKAEIPNMDIVYRLYAQKDYIRAKNTLDEISYQHFLLHRNYTKQDQIVLNAFDHMLAIKLGNQYEEKFRKEEFDVIIDGFVFPLINEHQNNDQNRRAKNN